MPAPFELAELQIGRSAPRRNDRRPTSLGEERGKKETDAEEEEGEEEKRRKKRSGPGGRDGGRNEGISISLVASGTALRRIELGNFRFPARPAD